MPQQNLTPEQLAQLQANGYLQLNGYTYRPNTINGQGQDGAGTSTQDGYLAIRDGDGPQGTSYDPKDAVGMNFSQFGNDGKFQNDGTTKYVSDWADIGIPLALAGGMMFLPGGALSGAMGGAGTVAGAVPASGAATGADLSAFYGGLDGGATLGGGGSFTGAGMGSTLGGGASGLASGADMSLFYGGADGGATLGGGGSFSGAGMSSTLNPSALASGGAGAAGGGAAGGGIPAAAGGASSGAGGLGSLLGSGSGLLGPAASILGALGGAAGSGATQSSQNRMDPRMDQFIYGGNGQQGLLSMAQGQLNKDMSPESLAGWDKMKTTGMGLLSTPQLGNGFSRFFPGK